MNRAAIANVLFFVCGAGTLLDVLLAVTFSSVPALASAVPIFVVSALCFALGMVANYLVAPPAPRSSKDRKN